MRSRYLDIDDRTQDLAEIFREDPATADVVLKKLEISWIYHENALEGLIFSREEIEAAIEPKPITEVSVLNASRDIRNFRAAVEVVRVEAQERKPRLALPLVTKLYETLHAGVELRAAAEFRKDIPLHRAYFHEIAQPARIPEQLEELFAWCESPEFKTLHTIQRASKLHHGFMQAYPFTDGSGKIARLLANVVLIHAGYQPCIIHTIDRQRYYESLKLPEAQLRELMMESIENALGSAEKLLREARSSRFRRAAR